ncbi:hypothetical protein [Actinopolymorpha singaporensis]|uniref:hypothetical protein n=1 Tax=Actinopolymorpha singaporensis TaxID=117157 RepID=UPI0015618CC6
MSIPIEPAVEHGRQELLRTTHQCIVWPLEATAVATEPGEQQRPACSVKGDIDRVVETMSDVCLNSPHAFDELRGLGDERVGLMLCERPSRLRGVTGPFGEKQSQQTAGGGIERDLLGKRVGVQFQTLAAGQPGPPVTSRQPVRRLGDELFHRDGQDCPVEILGKRDLVADAKLTSGHIATRRQHGMFARQAEVGVATEEDAHEPAFLVSHHCASDAADVALGCQDFVKKPDVLDRTLPTIGEADARLRRETGPEVALVKDPDPSVPVDGLDGGTGEHADREGQRSFVVLDVATEPRILAVVLVEVHQSLPSAECGGAGRVASNGEQQERTRKRRFQSTSETAHGRRFDRNPPLVTTAGMRCPPSSRPIRRSAR